MACKVYRVVGGTGGGSYSGATCSGNYSFSQSVAAGAEVFTPCMNSDTIVLTNLTTASDDCVSTGGGENILIDPQLALLQMVTSSETSFYSIYLDAGTLKFIPRAGSLTMEIFATAPVLRAQQFNLDNSLRNNALSPLIDSTGWKGNPLPQGPQGAQGSQGPQGAQGNTGGQGAIS